MRFHNCVAAGDIGETPGNGDRTCGPDQIVCTGGAPVFPWSPVQYSRTGTASEGTHRSLCSVREAVVRWAPDHSSRSSVYPVPGVGWLLSITSLLISVCRPDSMWELVSRDTGTCQRHWQRAHEYLQRYGDGVGCCGRVCS